MGENQNGEPRYIGPGTEVTILRVLSVGEVERVLVLVTDPPHAAGERVWILTSDLGP